MDRASLPLLATLPLALRQAGLAVGMHEYLGLLEGLSKGLGQGSVEQTRSLTAGRVAWTAKAAQRPRPISHRSG
jgi:hypothetical protein